MKSTKTILAVGLLIVGFAYVTHAYPPGGNGNNQECCGPQPEDIRRYFVACPPDAPPETGCDLTLIESVEGPNGFVITGVFLGNAASGSYKLFVDDGAGPVEMIGNISGLLSFTSGIPVAAGSVVTVTTSANQ